MGAALRNAAIFLFAAITVTVAGCDDPKYVVSPHYSYGIHILGMENFTTATGAAHIQVPVPAYGGKPILPFNDTLDKDLSINSGYGSWGTNIVFLNNYDIHPVRSLSVNTTPYGPMLDIGANETDYYTRYISVSPSPNPDVSRLPDGTYRFNKTRWDFDEFRLHMKDMLGPIGSAKTNDTVNALRLKPLYPDAGNVDTPFTQWLEEANASNLSYASYAYIDPALQARSPGHTIKLYAVFEVIVGYHPYGGPGDHYVYVIRESIPSGVTGYIPVKIQYAGLFHEYYVEDKWVPK